MKQKTSEQLLKIRWRGNALDKRKTQVEMEGHYRSDLKTWKISEECVTGNGEMETSLEDLLPCTGRR